MRRACWWLASGTRPRRCWPRCRTPGVAAGLAAALRSSIAVARGDAAAATSQAARAVELAPNAAAPRLAQSYARQLALDLDGATAAAGEAAALAPQEALPQARLAELYLMQGDLPRSRQAADEAARLGATPLTDIAQGFADLATYRASAAEAAFRRALQQESQNPTALLGLGLALIRRGDLAAGTAQLQNAAAADPASSLLRSYLGKAYFTGRDEAAAAKQYAIAKDLDPTDPTPWFYDAIRLQLANQPVAALRAVDRSIALNDHRAPFRSRLLLDRDQATRGASLAQIYQDLGLHPARHQRGAPRADARSGAAAPPIGSFPTCIRASRGLRRRGSASCCSRSCCSRWASTRSSRAWASPIST